MIDEELVVVATFDVPIKAHLAKNRLEAEGVGAFIQNEHHVAMDWLMSDALGGIQLVVRASDREIATQILSSTACATPSIDGADPASEDDPCPVCESTSTRQERDRRKWSLLSILFLGFPVPFQLRNTICDDCGHRC